MNQNAGGSMTTPTWIADEWIFFEDSNRLLDTFVLFCDVIFFVGKVLNARVTRKQQQKNKFQKCRTKSKVHIKNKIIVLTLLHRICNEFAMSVDQQYHLPGLRG